MNGENLNTVNSTAAGSDPKLVKDSPLKSSPLKFPGGLDDELPSAKKKGSKMRSYEEFIDKYILNKNSSGNKITRAQAAALQDYT